MKKGTGYTRTKENETVRLISPEDKTKEGSLFCFFSTDSNRSIHQGLEHHTQTKKKKLKTWRQF